MTRVAIQALGCKTNQADSESLSLALASHGYQLAGPEDSVDIYVLFSCTVTSVADRKCRNMLRRARQDHPGALLVVAGCYAGRSRQELAAPCSDLVVPGSDSARLVEEIVAARPAAKPDCAVAMRLPRTRAFVKIQDGCDASCAYCIVPSVRGPETSLPPEEVCARVETRLSLGYREVVLTGTNVGRYQYGEVTLAGLLARVLSTEGLQRLRLSSLQPRDMQPELLQQWQDHRLCRHFHMPLQSGSRETLRRMRRRYSLEQYYLAVNMVREAVPGASVTTDVIVAFPGETDQQHAESLSFVAGMEFAAIHVFPYSIRPGTDACLMPGQVPPQARKRRADEFLALAAESSSRFRSRFLGQALEVLWEGWSQRKGGVWTGLTDNYIRVMCKSAASLENQIVPATLERCDRVAVWARPEMERP